MILECGCPGEFPAEWDKKDVDLGDYCIHRLPVPMLVHMPLAFEVYVQRQQRMIDGLGLRERWPGDHEQPPVAPMHNVPQRFAHAKHMPSGRLSDGQLFSQLVRSHEPLGVEDMDIVDLVHRETYKRENPRTLAATGGRGSGICAV